MKKSKRTTQKPARRRGGWLWAVLAGAVLLGSVALMAWRSGAASGTPKLHVDQEKVDLGDVRLGQSVAVAFEVTNTGDAPLRFREPPYIEVVEGC